MIARTAAGATAKATPASTTRSARVKVLAAVCIATVSGRRVGSG